MIMSISVFFSEIMDDIVLEFGLESIEYNPLSKALQFLTQNKLDISFNLIIGSNLDA